MELTNELKRLYIDTANKLKGSDRRLFMARVAGALGYGGQSRAARELGWNRGTIRKATRELDTGQVIEDNVSARGRKPAEHHLRHLLEDIESIVEQQMCIPGKMNGQNAQSEHPASRQRRAPSQLTHLFTFKQLRSLLSHRFTP